VTRQRAVNTCSRYVPNVTLSNGQAPTFETVAKTPGMTAIALTAVLRTPHRNMPNIIIAEDDLRNVVAYVLSLQ
jgi:hypothetical protein